MREIFLGPLRFWLLWIGAGRPPGDQWPLFSLVGIAAGSSAGLGSALWWLQRRGQGQRA